MNSIYTGSYYTSPSSWTIPATSLYTRRIPRNTSTEPESSELSRTQERITHRRNIDGLRDKYLAEFNKKGMPTATFNMWFNRLSYANASYKKLDVFCRAAGIILDNDVPIETLDRIGESSLRWTQKGVSDEVFKACIKLEINEIFEMKKIDEDAARKTQQRFEKNKQETKKIVRGMWIQTVLEGLVYGLGAAAAWAIFG